VHSVRAGDGPCRGSPGGRQGAAHGQRVVLRDGRTIPASPYPGASILRHALPDLPWCPVLRTLNSAVSDYPDKEGVVQFAPRTRIVFAIGPGKTVPIHRGSGTGFSQSHRRVQPSSARHSNRLPSPSAPSRSDRKTGANQVQAETPRRF